MRLVLVLLVITLVVGGILYFYLGREPTKTVEEYCLEGKTLLKRCKTKEAIDLMQEAIRHYPDEPALYWNLGLIYSQGKNFKKARKYFKKCLDCDPENTSARIAYVGCLVRMAKNKEEAWRIAISELAKIPKEERSQPNVSYNLACMYAVNGKPRLAIQYLSNAISLQADYRDMAKVDRDLDNIRYLPEFKRLVY